MLVLITALLSAATAQERRLLTGHVSAEATPAAALDRHPAASTLNLAIGPPLPNHAALTAPLQEIYDPASLNYRHFLTSEQFT